ncbi:unnamed protein product [Staurois parvus]|uniref:Uncharacterized protein n=1 Tax=Staurois parvus TaxID=386267 RepID=A0ABN9DW42_9NEOB|nr:unnamed protein product [Staurois parvus]
MPISASQCHPSVCISATYQCQSVLPISVHQCRLSVASQCRLTAPVSAAY